MIGASICSKVRVPNLRRSSSQPSTQPGTDRLSGPWRGMLRSFLAANNSRVALYGDRPLAFRPYSFFVFASQTMAYRSPPMPHDVGSISPRAALVAMAASMALPPFLRTSRPTCAASGWLVATIPCGAMTTERPGRSALAGAAHNRNSAIRRQTFMEVHLNWLAATRVFERSAVAPALRSKTRVAANRGSAHLLRYDERLAVRAGQELVRVGIIDE